MEKQRIAFFGLGTMGSGMARRLLAAGYPLAVFNRNRAKAEPLAKDGATLADSPRQAAAGADILIAMLADDTASGSIWLGENGAFAGAKSGAICIDCSTLTVPFVQQLAVAAKARGLHFMDGPVTGTKPHAANGELTFLVGGNAADLERARPALAVMSKEIIHLGPVGSGAALKLINNFFCGVQAAALGEALSLLDRAGLDASKALPLLLNGAPGSPLVKTLATRHAAGDYTPNFQLRLMTKDLAYAIEMANNHGLTLKTGHVAFDLFKDAANAGLGDEDLSAIIKHLK